ncbi:hypothetical protein CDV36_003184 [Fusarium kuroshium]|uniref:Uncharacterized protein n=1 Tax=Fusarium kuroshium TaxID=2010991 RepID=A0A3M2SHW0_9HYPO|nr:hypothetical protein CDV36_003184 [Fusarium kuroshium]
MDQATRRKKPSKAGERVFKTKTCNIPSLTELRKSLGYGHRGEEQDIAFKRALTAQVETFVSRDNLPGVSFTKWKTPAHQKGLRDMTKDFLFVKGKGLEFWPDDPNSPNKRPLEYTRDYEEIHRLLTKVFYRTAREHKRKQSTTSTTQDSTHKPKSTSTKQPHSNKNSNEQSPREACRDSRGQSADDPIELYNMQSTTNASGPSVDVDPFAESTRRFTFEQFVPLGVPDGIPPEEEPIDRVWEIRDDYLNIQADNSASNIPSHTAPVKDPYQGPNSPTEDTHVPRDRGKRPAQPYSIQDVRPAKVPRQEQHNIEVVAGSSTGDPPSNNPSTNMGSTINSSSNFAPISIPSQDAPPADPPSAIPVKKRGYTHHKYKQTRSSDRPRKPVQLPGFAREQTIDIALMTSSSEDEEEQDKDRDGGLREPPRPAVNLSDDTSRREKPSSNPPRGSNTSRPQRSPAQESQAGPSRQRNSTQQQANGSSRSGSGTRQSERGQPRAERDRPPRNNPVPTGERQVISSSTIFCLRHDGEEFRPWTPSADVFQMSLSELMQDLDWPGGNAQTLYMRLYHTSLDAPFAVDIMPGDNAMFNSMRRSFVRQMQRCYQRTGERNLEFEIHFKPL